MRTSFKRETTANLANGAVFTGNKQSTQRYGRFRVTATVSHVSATNGLAVEQSSDGTTWELTDAITTTVAGPNVIEALVRMPYIRVKYTNGGTTTTTLRIASALIEF